MVQLYGYGLYAANCARGTGRISLIRLCGSQGTDQIDMKYLLCTADGLWIPNRNKDIEGLRWINSFMIISPTWFQKGVLWAHVFLVVSNSSPKKGGLQPPLSSCISFQPAALTATQVLIQKESQAHVKQNSPAPENAPTILLKKKCDDQNVHIFLSIFPGKHMLKENVFFSITAAFMHWIL